MKKILSAILAIAASTAFGADRYVSNPDSGGSFKVKVNNAGTMTDVLTMTSTGIVTIGPSTGGGLSHVIQSNGLTNLNIVAASGSLTRLTFKNGSSSDWQIESGNGSDFRLFAAATTNVFDVTQGGVVTIGPAAFVNTPHLVNGSLKLNSGTTSIGSVSNATQLEMGAGIYRDISGNPKASATQTGYTEVLSERSNGAGNSVFRVIANYQDAQTLDSSVVSTNSFTLLQVNGNGLTTIGQSGSTQTNVNNGSLQITKTLLLSGSSSGSTTLQAAAAASGTLTVPSATTTLAGLGIVETFTAAQTMSGGLTSSGATVVSGTLTQGVCTKSADYTITTTDGCALVSMTTAGTARTVTLPDATASAGRIITIRKADSGTGKNTVTRAGSDTIDGLTSADVYGQYGQITLMALSGVWSIVSWQDIYSFAPTVTFINAVVDTVTPTATWVRANRMVTLKFTTSYKTGTGVVQVNIATTQIPDGGNASGNGTDGGVCQRSNSNGVAGTFNRFGSNFQAVCSATECGASGSLSCAVTMDM